MSDRRFRDPRSPEPGGQRVGTLDLPEDAAPDLVRLLERAAGPAESGELRSEAAAVAAFVTRQGASAGTSRHWRPSRRTGALAALTVSGSLVLGGGLAAADVLPTPAQRWVSSALGSIGIDVPSPSDREAGPRSGEGPGQTPADTTVVDAESAAAPAPAGVPTPGGTTDQPVAPNGTPSPGTTASETPDPQGPVPARPRASTSTDTPGQSSGNGNGAGNTNGTGDSGPSRTTPTQTKKPSTPAKVGDAPRREPTRQAVPTPKNSGRGTSRDASERSVARGVTASDAASDRASTRSAPPSRAQRPEQPASTEKKVSVSRPPRT